MKKLFPFVALTLAFCSPADQARPERESPSAREVFCPSTQPDELTQRVIDTYLEQQPQRLRAAAERTTPNQAFHLYRALNHLPGTQRTLEKIFEEYGVACPGFKPSIYDLNNRAQKELEGGSLNAASKLFTETDDTEGQLRVARAYEQRAIKLDLGYDYDSDSIREAIRLYRAVKHEGEVQRIATTIFAQTARTETAVQELQRMSIRPDRAMYNARGDYWLNQAGGTNYNSMIGLPLAFEAYSRADDIGRINTLRQTIEALPNNKKNVFLDVAAKAALYLGDREMARRYAEENFIHGVKSKEGIALLREVGLPGIPAELYVRRAEVELGENMYQSAFDDFNHANNRAGIQRVVDAVSEL